MRPSEYRAWFERECRKAGTSWHYTADRSEWFALPARRHVSVPAPFDSASLAICVHELGHVLIGVCPRTGDHFRTRRGCVACESASWRAGRALLPASFDVAMVERMRAALGTYLRARTPAPYTALQAAKAILGRVSVLAEQMREIKWQARWDKNRAAERAGRYGR